MSVDRVGTVEAGSRAAQAVIFRATWRINIQCIVITNTDTAAVRAATLRLPMRKTMPKVRNTPAPRRCVMELKGLLNPAIPAASAFDSGRIGKT